MVSRFSDALLRLPEAEARARVFASSNRRRLRILTLAFTGLCAIMALVALAPTESGSRDVESLSQALLLMLAFAVMWRVSKQVLPPHRVDALVLSFSLALFLLFFFDDQKPLFWQNHSNFRRMLVVLFPLALMVFRLSWSGLWKGSLVVLWVGLIDLLTPMDADSWHHLFKLCMGILSFGTPAIAITAFRHHTFRSAWRAQLAEHRERLRMQDELAHARRIQLSMLPQQIPEIPHLDVACVSLPAMEVGGDFYDFFPISDHELGVVVADVSGHGLAAGLILSGIKTGMHLLKASWRDPLAVLQSLNAALKATTEKNTFVTFLFAVFDTRQGHVTLANAGHLPALQVQAEQNRLLVHRLPALPLGGVTEAQFADLTCGFQPGDTFVLVTDGFTEALNSEQKAFGEQRLQDLVTQLAREHSSAKDILDSLLERFREFTAHQDQEDDVTLVVIRVS